MTLFLSCRMASQGRSACILSVNLFSLAKMAFYISLFKAAAISSHCYRLEGKHWKWLRAFERSVAKVQFGGPFTLVSLELLYMGYFGTLGPILLSNPASLFS